ncbi:NADPH-dependent F420 reductase [Micromonospora echinofusca]|uniref:NAD(P)-binding domain-containing protein n=1 Tax=Micromonospora echinofusca TaxID=47858 RepID=A0ABS3VWB5_MICEH|nr:NAD(P)-binding domain-containing protein [Micromonospora echinofusca]MBO4208793.1 NAD(P)-binding domain-containing protein [Micromonospora echinofusca]
MRIGIIGAGRLGGVLARHCASAGHEVVIANSRDPATLAPLVRSLVDGAVAVRADEVARRADRLVLLAVPFHRHPELPTDGLAGKIVVDATNYLPAVDGPWPELETGRTTSSELVRDRLGGIRLVKTFNTMRWDHLRDYGHEAGALQRYGMPLASDDNDAKRAVEDLVEQFGFDPVDTGDLAGGGRRQQPGGPAWLADLPGPALRARLGVPAYR